MYIYVAQQHKLWEIWENWDVTCCVPIAWFLAAFQYVICLHWNTFRHFMLPKKKWKTWQKSLGMKTCLVLPHLYTRCHQCFSSHTLATIWSLFVFLSTVKTKQETWSISFHRNSFTLATSLTCYEFVAISVCVNHVRVHVCDHFHPTDANTLIRRCLFTALPCLWCSSFSPPAVFNLDC